MTSRHPRSPRATKLTFRTPEDVLAAVPVLLGFEPADSVVMLTFGGRETFHARIDMPPPTRGRRGGGPAARAGPGPRVEQVLFVVYADDERLAERC